MSKPKDEYLIFVVDDEPLIVSTLAQILKLQGFEVSCFINPLKALEAMQSRAPDFLITDVVMPEMSGIELAIVVRETCPSCTVLLFSGQFATHQLLAEARNRGHDFEVLPKPVHPVEILARIFGQIGPGSGSDGSTGRLLS
jgi:DNA-binding response OmpR family regulator